MKITNVFRFIEPLLDQKKILIAVIVLAAVGLLVARHLGILGSREPAYRLETVKRDNLSATINASGTVEGEREATLNFLTTGRLAAIYVKEGDEVYVGEILASLDATEAQNSLSRTEASLRDAQSDLDKVMDDIRLFQYGNQGTTGETQTQKNLRESAETARDIAYRGVQTAKKQLQWTLIIAPFDGAVSGIKEMEVGQNITASGSSITMIGHSVYKFVANVDEIDFSRLAVGQEGEIILDAYPNDKFTATISKIGIAATKLSTGGSVVPIELVLPDDDRFKSGLNGEVNFNVVSKINVLTLTRSAVRNDNGNKFVYVLNNNRPEKRAVTTGDSLGSLTEILSGIKEGEQVIVGGVKL